jgi:hypothetical protein
VLLALVAVLQHAGHLDVPVEVLDCLEEEEHSCLEAAEILVAGHMVPVAPVGAVVGHMVLVLSAEVVVGHTVT